MPRWLPRVLARIHELADAGRIRLTSKALDELEALPVSLDPDDAGTCCASYDSGLEQPDASAITEEGVIWKPAISESSLRKGHFAQ